MSLKQLVSKAEIPLFILVLAVLAMIFVLILTDHAVPQYLYVVLSALLAGGLGIAAPTTASVAPELPAEVTGLVGDLRKVFATLTEPAPTTAAAAPTSAPPAATLTTVTTVPPPVAS